MNLSMPALTLLTYFINYDPLIITMLYGRKKAILPFFSVVT